MATLLDLAIRSSRKISVQNRDKFFLLVVQRSWSDCNPHFPTPGPSRNSLHAAHEIATAIASMSSGSHFGSVSVRSLELMICFGLSQP